MKGKTAVKQPFTGCVPASSLPKFSLRNSLLPCLNENRTPGKKKMKKAFVLNKRNDVASTADWTHKKNSHTENLKV